MIKGLYTAATGMSAQQNNIDVISNNIANVNTTGFKKDRAEFQDLMYQSLNYTAGATSANSNNPTGIDIGSGVKLSNIQKEFSQGNLVNSGNDWDIAIQGHGFFQIENSITGETMYTRNGAFKVDGANKVLVNSQGFPLVGSPNVPAGTTNISISEDGIVSGILPGATDVQQLGRIELAVFTNTAGLRPMGNNLFSETAVSGAPTTGTPGSNGIGTLQHGYLENANVSLVTEMVNLITAQRAYEANSKSIQTTDAMLQTVNQLKR